MYLLKVLIQKKISVLSLCHKQFFKQSTRVKRVTDVYLRDQDHHMQINVLYIPIGTMNVSPVSSSDVV